MAEVVGLFGDVPTPGEPVPSCVAALEQWLEMARAGEIAGLALAGVTNDGKGCYILSGIVGSYALLGASAMARAELEAEMLEMRE